MHSMQQAIGTVASPGAFLLRGEQSLPLMDLQHGTSGIFWVSGHL